jgi:hypothetical protein
MLWVACYKIHVGRWASAWLIEIHRKRGSSNSHSEDSIPSRTIEFALPNAQIKPIERQKTTYDALVTKHHLQDPYVLKIGRFIHFETDAEEDENKPRFKETLELCFVLLGWKKHQERTTKLLEER